MLHIKILHFAGHLLLASSAYAGIKTYAIAQATEVGEKANYYKELADPYLFVGVAVPNYVGWIFFFLALVFGSALSIYQKTEVDEHINHPRLKPVYSFFFGMFVTLFGIPFKFPDITIWQLILPAMVMSGIGSIVIYYSIVYVGKSKLWQAIGNKIDSKVEDI